MLFCEIWWRQVNRAGAECLVLLLMSAIAVKCCWPLGMLWHSLLWGLWALSTCKMCSSNTWLLFVIEFVLLTDEVLFPLFCRMIKLNLFSWICSAVTDWQLSRCWEMIASSQLMRFRFHHKQAESTSHVKNPILRRQMKMRLTENGANPTQ